MCNGMHDCSIATGDTWASKNLKKLIAWDAANDGVLILTFDENGGTAGNQIAPFCRNVLPGQYDPQDITHYSVLRTIEDIFGVKPLGNARLREPDPRRYQIVSHLCHGEPRPCVMVSQACPEPVEGSDHDQVKRLLNLLIAVALTWTSFMLPSQAEPATQALGLSAHPCLIGKARVPSECGTFGVYENRAARAGRIIQLNFVLLHASRKRHAP